MKNNPDKYGLNYYAYSIMKKLVKIKNELKKLL